MNTLEDFILNPAKVSLTDEIIKEYMIKYSENYYSSREILLRMSNASVSLEDAQCGEGKPPKPFDSWGDYWKSY